MAISAVGFQSNPIKSNKIKSKIIKITEKKKGRANFPFVIRTNISAAQKYMWECKTTKDT